MERKYFLDQIFQTLRSWIGAVRRMDSSVRYAPMLLVLVVLGAIAVSYTQAHAQGQADSSLLSERSATLCQPKWLNLPLQLDTNPATAKPYGNNVDTAYLEFGYTVDVAAKLIIKGMFPPVRFISFQVGDLKTGSKVTGFIPDYEFVMDQNSSNPYHRGNQIRAARRNYTIEIVPHGATSDAPNKIILPPGAASRQLILIRYYSPNDNYTISSADVPKVYAQHVSDNKPAPCPTFTPIPNVSVFPMRMFLREETKPKKDASFREAKCGGGCNAALPAYLMATPYMSYGEVAVIRFKAPSFVNTRRGAEIFPDQTAYDTRYWSMSLTDPTTSKTVGGLVDYMATPDAQGFVTLVVSNDDRVQRKAMEDKHNGIQDRRNRMARYAVFVYRNLVPSRAFWPPDSPYPAQYRPHGAVCSVSEYLGNSPKCSPASQ